MYKDQLITTVWTEVFHYIVISDFHNWLGKECGAFAVDCPFVEMMILPNWLKINKHFPGNKGHSVKDAGKVTYGCRSKGY